MNMNISFTCLNLRGNLYPSFFLSKGSLVACVCRHIWEEEVGGDDYSIGATT